MRSRVADPGLYSLSLLAARRTVVAMHVTAKLLGCINPTPTLLLITALLQVWFDSPDSLAAKYELAAQLGLRGVGIWHLDCLDYHCTDAACRNETGAMWAALRVFTGAAESSGRPAELKAAGQGQKQATAGAAAARLVVQQAAQRRRVESGMAAE